MTLVKKHRFWMLWAASLAVLSWYWLTDPDGGAETIARVQWLAWLLVVSGPVYLLRKALMPGDSAGLLKDARAGSLPAAVAWLVLMLFRGCPVFGLRNTQPVACRRSNIKARNSSGSGSSRARPPLTRSCCT